MTENVVSLRPPSDLSGYLRLGHSGHRKLAELHAGGRMHFRRVVVDAAYFVEQLDVIRDLQSDGCEVVLDPNFAEMATIGRHGSSTLQRLPWSRPGRAWAVDDFSRPTNFDVAKAIAEFAVAADVSALLAPTHLHEPGSEVWRSIDLQLCQSLRDALDKAGGSDIALDYQWITTADGMKDGETRQQLVRDLVDLPIENLWIRSAGFGAKATGAALRNYTQAVGTLHEAGKPIISDMTGGFAGLAALALGASAGMAHGIAVRETFNIAGWKTPRKGSGPMTTRIYVAELDRYFTQAQLRAIFALRGGKARAGCLDRSCCPQGADDMIDNSEAHFLARRHQQLKDMSAVPDARRGAYLLDALVTPALQTARLLDRAEKTDAALAKILQETKSRLGRLHDAIKHQSVEAPLATRSRSPRFRGGTGCVSAILRQ